MKRFLNTLINSISTFTDIIHMYDFLAMTKILYGEYRFLLILKSHQGLYLEAHVKK